MIRRGPAIGRDSQSRNTAGSHQPEMCTNASKRSQAGKIVGRKIMLITSAQIQIPNSVYMHITSAETSIHVVNIISFPLSKGNSFS